MNDVTTETTPVKSQPPELATKLDGVGSSFESCAMPDESRAEIVYPPLEMADPLVFWFNPFKK